MVDLHSDRAERGHAWAAERVWASTQKPFAVVCGVTSAIQESAAARLRSSGIPVLEDVPSGLRAFLHLFERATPARCPTQAPDPVPRETVRRWREALIAGERSRRGQRAGDARRLRGACGAYRRCDRPRGALAAAGRLGYPSP